MNKLYVSYDFGCRYSCVVKSASMEEIVKKAEAYDKQRLRWYIEKSDGSMDYEHTNQIHKSILDFMQRWAD